MLSTSRAYSSFSVNDLEEAKIFYGDVLGLEVKAIGDKGLQLNLSGGTIVMIYPKDDHKPAAFTILNFPVTDIEKVVAALKKQNIKFENYEGELQTDEKSIYRGTEKGYPDIAWFKDPAGNILSVLKQ